MGCLHPSGRDSWITDSLAHENGASPPSYHKLPATPTTNLAYASAGWHSGGWKKGGGLHPGGWGSLIALVKGTGFRRPATTNYDHPQIPSMPAQWAVSPPKRAGQRRPHGRDVAAQRPPFNRYSIPLMPPMAGPGSWTGEAFVPARPPLHSERHRARSPDLGIQGRTR